MKKLFIIGAGASGLMAAVSAAGRAEHIKENITVTVIEHMNRAGIKLSRTGNGRCNLTNEFISDACYQNDNTSFVMHIIEKFTPHDTIAFFNSIGVLTKARCGYAGSDKLPFRYIYPNSDQAATVAEALTERALELGVRFEYETKAEKIEKSKDTFIITAVKAGKNVKYSADALIVAAGSKAAPDTGSDGSGYKLAKMLGHNIVKPLPALVQLESCDKVCKIMAGVRSDGNIEIYTDRDIYTANGELQFTEYGISGIPVFQVSRHAVRALDAKKKVYARIDLLPLLDSDSLCRMFKKASEENQQKTLYSVLCKMMNKKLACAVLYAAGISKETPAAGLSCSDIKRTTAVIKEFSLKINGCKSFDKAQICSGGVTLSELDENTLESKLVPGLYFCGELLDVDAICGGYNLQWAWSSGFTAGNAAAAQGRETE